MKRLWERIGSLFLAFCMIFTMLPTMVLADESGEEPFVTGFRAERVGEQTVNFYFTPSTTGKFGYVIKKQGSLAPTDLWLNHDMMSIQEYNVTPVNTDISAYDILDLYLQIENDAGVKSELYCFEVPAYIAPTDAEPPNIYEHPTSATYEQNETPRDLLVLASSTDGGSLSYQWYKNTTESTDGGTPISGSASVNGCTPSTDTVGTSYYYCVVTSTNDKATTNKTATTTSEIATVTIEPLNQTYPVTLNIRKDGAPFTSQERAYYLELKKGSETTQVLMTGTGETRTVSVGKGTWRVCEGRYSYTDVTITVAYAPVDATLDYYTVNYSAVKDGTTTDGGVFISQGPWIGNPDYIPSGGYLEEGTGVTFTAMGFGAENYTYEWSGTHGGEAISGTESTYTINSVEGTVDIACKITGIGENVAPIPGDTGTITVDNITGNSLTLNWERATTTVGGGLQYAVFQSTSPDISTVIECLKYKYPPLNSSDDINTYVVNDLSPNTTYYFNILVLDDNEGMAAYKMITATTAEDTTPTITITKHPQDITVTQGRIHETLEAKAISNNGKPVRYQWHRALGGIGSDNAERIPGATSSTFTIPANLTLGTYQYFCMFDTDGTDGIGSDMATVTVKRPSSSSSSSGGNDSSSESNSSAGGGVASSPKASNAPTQQSVNIQGTVDNNGNVVADIANKTVFDAIDKAMKEAGKNGTQQNGITLILDINTDGKPVDNLSVKLSKEVQDTLIGKGVSVLTITVGGSDIAISMDIAALKEMNLQAGGNVSLNINRVNKDTLTGNAKDAIGDRPVFNFKADCDNGKAVQNFGAGSVSVTVAYTLGANENPENIQAVYVDEKGNLQWLDSVYDSSKGELSFSTNHFSIYGVGYKQDAPSFIDISDHWAKDDIAFVANRGIFSGTSATNFSPDLSMTRGMFVTALGRLANADVSTYTQSSFTDVKSDAYYMGYVEWANKNNIVMGIGDGKFAPDKSITREQMAVILQSYAKAVELTLPKVHEENTFGDSTKISAYAKEDVKQVQMAGIISGRNNNLFDPQGTATRAEVSSVLRRFVELEASSDTAVE
ncbi:MAG: hypothetical protein GX299_05100 [Epulopiscium sp.]|nr:hypothetical protein [Candidatus Epulonipiscium sp.]